jgi:potassium channel
MYIHIHTHTYVHVCLRISGFYDGEALSPTANAIDSTVVAVFGIDILCTFNTAYFDAMTDELITDRRTIASRYLRTWLALDLISTIPFDEVTI